MTRTKKDFEDRKTSELKMLYCTCDDKATYDVIAQVIADREAGRGRKGK